MKKLSSLLLSLLLAVCVVAGPLAQPKALAESKTHAITTEVKNENGDISGMYTMENVVVTEQADGSYLVRMHQVSENRNYMAIVPDQTTASKDMATNHEVDWYIGTVDNYTFTIPVASLKDTVYLSFSKTANITAGKAWSNVMALTFDLDSMVETDSDDVTAAEMNVDPAIKNEPESIELTASSLTAMFKVVSATIVKNGDTVTLRFALSGTGYQDLYIGKYEDAVLTTSGDTVDQSDWVHYTLNDAGKYEFEITIDEGQTFIPVVGLSASKAASGTYAWYPRQLTIDYEALTIVSDDYNHADPITLTNENSAFSASSAELLTLGGPNSNNYKETLILTMANADLNQAYVGSAAEAATASDVIAIDESNTFSIPVRANKMGGFVDYDYFDKETTVAFHSTEDDSWTEVTLVVSKTAGSLLVKGNELAITSQPADYTGKIGDQASFKVVASGTGLTYQWYYSKDGERWYESTIAGCNTDTLNVKLIESRNGQMYKCIVTDANGESVTSDVAALAKTPAAVQITKQPVDFAGIIGQNAEFTVTAEGTGLSYQWYYSKDGQKWSKSSAQGYDSNTLQIKMTEARVGNQYRCVITDENGNELVSEAGRITKKQSGFNIIENPEDAKVAVNTTVEFTCKAVGEGLTYQWYYSKNGGTSWTKSSANGAETNTLTIKAITNRNNQMYRCKITAADGTYLYTEAASIILSE